jgi:hypothetical protein
MIGSKLWHKQGISGDKVMAYAIVPVVKESPTMCNLPGTGIRILILGPFERHLQRKLHH